MKEYKELENLLHGLIGKVKFDPNLNLKLERITHLLKLLGNPQNKFASIHVGGTSGKGSTSIMISAILREAGYKTGLHISPYLQVLNEQFQINNAMVSSSKLLQLAKKIMPAVEQVAKDGSFGKPSYFEVKVALAFMLFAAEKVDVAVVEVGLGGKLDATNVLNSKVAVLTNVGLDHTAILGETIEEIITDKAEIIKPNQTVVSGVTQVSAQKIVANKCQEIGAKLLQCVTENPKNFQQINATCATMTAQAFAKQKLTTEQIQAGLKKIKIPGRMEEVQKNPLVILDGAHNPDKMRALVSSLKKEYPGKKWLPVVAFKEDKDAEEMLKLLIENSDTIMATEFHDTPLWNSYQAQEVAGKIKAHNSTIEILSEKNPLKALEKMLEVAKNKKDSLVLVTGSLYLIGNVRSHWYPIEELL